MKVKIKIAEVQKLALDLMSMSLDQKFCAYFYAEAELLGTPIYPAEPSNQLFLRAIQEIYQIAGAPRGAIHNGSTAKILNSIIDICAKVLVEPTGECEHVFPITNTCHKGTINCLKCNAENKLYKKNEFGDRVLKQKLMAPAIIHFYGTSGLSYSLSLCMYEFEADAKNKCGAEFHSWPAKIDPETGMYVINEVQK